MGVTCTNLQFMYSGVDYGTTGAMTARWKCASSEVKSYEVGFEYFSTQQKTWLTDSVTSVNHVTYDGWVTTNYTSHDENTAMMVHFIVTPICEHTVRDAKGNEKKETYRGDTTVSADVEAPQYHANAPQAQKSKDKWKTTNPADPTIAVAPNADVTKATITVTAAADNRVGAVEIQRSVDGGSWATAKRDVRWFTGASRQFETDQVAWQYSFADSLSRGHSYSYRARVGNMIGSESGAPIEGSGASGTKCAFNYSYDVSHSENLLGRNFDRSSAYVTAMGSGEDVLVVVTRPASPTFDSISLAGPDSITVAWTENGKNTDHYDVQYSSYVTSAGKNAWEAGAVDEIRHMTVPGTARKATVAGLDHGVAWYFRVYAVNDTGEGAATFVGSDGKSGYMTRKLTIAKPTPNYTIPTGLKAELLSNAPSTGEYSAKLTWSDKTLEGESYVVEHSTYAKAWENNAASAIDSSDEQTVCYYTTGALDKGMTHYFRLRKVHGEDTAYAGSTVKVSVPAETSQQLARPTKLTAKKRDSTSVTLTLTAAALSSGESWQVQCSDDPDAFTQNILSAISEVTVDEAGANPVITVADLDYGRTWYFRVRRRGSDAVSDWKPMGSEDPLSVTLPSTLGKLNRPTALKATLVNAPGAEPVVEITWEDTLEEGAIYVVQHTKQYNAFVTNAADLIDEVETDGGSGTTKHRGWTENLDKGIKHCFRVYKKKDGYANHYAWISGTTNSTVYAEIPTTPSSEIDAPANFAAVEQNGRARLTWTTQDALGEGESFQVQYADYEGAFAVNDVNAISELSLDESDGTSHALTVSGLDEGTTYFFRVRRRTSEAASYWTPDYTAQSHTAVSVDIPPSAESLEQLGAPTPTVTQLSYCIDETVPLSWTHNSGDNSEQSAWQVELVLGDGTAAYINGTGDAGMASVASLDLSDAEYSFTDGSTASWRVRTQGAWPGYWSPWSRRQSFGIYDRPVAGVGLSESTVTGLPMTITVTATSPSGTGLPESNAPLSCVVSISPAEDTVEQRPDGTERRVAAGEAIWTARRSATEEDGYTSADGWTLEVGAGDVSLQPSISYTVFAAVTTRQGMRCEESATFDVEWDGDVEPPTAYAAFYPDSLTCRIWPRCEVIVENRQDDPTQPDDYVWGLREDTVLSVWRVNQDGTTDLVADNVPNDGEQLVEDAHCAFGSCTYRIVAADTETGAQSSAEVNVPTAHERVVVEFGAEIVELAYNIEWTEEHSPDVEFLSFHGRKSPVAHWGTQQGQTAKIRAALIKGTDADTLAKLRRLSAYRGACYVREPTGPAWWASVVPSSMGGGYSTSSQSVELDITRIEA